MSSGLGTFGGERGSLTLWLLGWCVALLFLGGLSLDLWRVFTERRALAGLVDAAAVAGASAVDETSFRIGEGVRLDPVRAAAAADAVLAAGSPPRNLVRWERRADPDAVRVTAVADVPVTLLGVLLPQAGPLRVTVSATVEPRPSG